MLTNSGTVNIGETGLTASTNVTASGLVNTGTLLLQGNSTSGTTNQATLNILGAAPATVSGTVAVQGDADLEFASGGVTSIASGATLKLVGAQARVRR